MAVTLKIGDLHRLLDFLYFPEETTQEQQIYIFFWGIMDEQKQWDKEESDQPF